MGLEILVRPLVVPAARPNPAQQTTDDDDDGVAFDGGAGRPIELSHSRSVSYSKQNQTELKRAYDVVRIHNPDDDTQYVDDEVTTALLIKPSGKPPVVWNLAKPKPADNIEKISSNNIRSNPDASSS